MNQISGDDLLLREEAEGVVTLRMNRPVKFNSLSEGMLGALSRAVEDIAASPAVRCVVIAGEGRAFCAGHDLEEMRGQPRYEYYRALFGRCGQLMLALQRLPVPVIARVHGVATAAGCQLVASCDLAIAAESARFAVSGVNLGLFCSTPSVPLSRNVAAKHAFDMLVTGRFIDARTALEWGLVNEVAPDAALDDAVSRKTQEILSKSAAAIRHGKTMFYRQRQMAAADAYDYAAEVMARNMMEQDARDGIDGFLHKSARR